MYQEDTSALPPTAYFDAQAGFRNKTHKTHSVVRTMTVADETRNAVSPCRPECGTSRRKRIKHPTGRLVRKRSTLHPLTIYSCTTNAPSATSVSRVSEGANEEGDVEMLRWIFRTKNHGHLRVEARRSCQSKVGLGIESNPVRPFDEFLHGVRATLPTGAA